MLDFSYLKAKCRWHSKCKCYSKIKLLLAEKNLMEQERQIVARYACLTPSCKAGACTGQNSSMKNNKGH